ncbi:neurosecretory protein VGF isoform X2 [Poecilia reticulata]|uniref:VGF nerve growth factor inducible n=2 Tax=Poecilia reticulata TaxID=8081 RepID=A0A3P9N4M6_POERE|nr:PREDICTED: neurosecretory protein VGF isoform X2 [Poecilia reticulata]XP_008433197.1 PREDICTED: neurosecretory protein VGF isoform X2 [Poecilia reticulata]XP_008433199.1 PREDICTED: neurosecretory protein VGF isoform X2 [Poecilia reticulata]XP_017165757.1 PREDICTED: neurosecretory protein VGF isoform X2 [Poecilia reticulata]
MTRNCHASCLVTIMVLFTSLSFLHLSTPNPVSTFGDYDNPPREVLPKLSVYENTERTQERRKRASKDQTEQGEELFEDIDPKRLAAVLLEALNHTHMERERDEENYNFMEKETQAERDEIQNKEPHSERVSRNRERDEQKELELFIASHGKEREEEEEKKKALEEEEKITEKVTSHTTSQTVQIQTKQQPNGSDGTAESSAANQQGSSNPEQSNYEEEEQLNSEELKSLETVMKEFPRLNTKRDGTLEQQQRNTRGYSSYNDIIPINKGSDLAMTKKKLKWQEETQKAVYFPTFTGGNSVEESEEGNFINKATQPPTPTEQEEVQDDYTEEEEDLLSPEEEEARAKVEQEEMMRQAAEAQKAKMEEEKLADIASDMLLSYMGKQNKGNKKHSLSMSNAAEDKRSDEEEEATEEDDLDPQTIDKLIEISSKLHLPADDVVDIITDVEKKKKKDVPPEMASLRQYTSAPLSPSFHSGWQVSSNQNSFPVSKQQSPAVNILKTWFQDKNTPKSDVSQRKLPKPLQPYNFSPKPEKSFPVKQERWFKLPKSVWTGYSLYPYSYSTYHQRKPILGYYPFYFPPMPRSKSHYYRPKPPFTPNNYFGNSVEDPYIFPPRRHYQNWFQPQLRKSPVALQPKSFYSSYYPRPYSQPFQRIPPSQANSPPQTASQQKQFLISALDPAASKNKDYHKGAKQPDSSIHDDVEKYIQQILMNRAQRLD